MSVNNANNYCSQMEEGVRKTLLQALPQHKEYMENMFTQLCRSDSDYRQVMRVMNNQMSRGLQNETDASIELPEVPMLASFIRSLPDGTAKGQYLGLDMGGTNFRVLLVELDGRTAHSEVESVVLPAHILTGTGTELFDFIANCLWTFLKRKGLLSTPEPLPLGFTFSFMCTQLALNKAILVEWTKGIQCEGVVGQEVVSMLQAAIDRKEGLKVRCNAILNDTVGALMAGALKDPKCTVGLVLGTGMNAAYVEKLENVGKWKGDQDDPKQMIVDAEWYSLGRDGSLDFFRSEVDFEMDDGVLCDKGQSIYEKMISGLFLGEVVRLTILKMRDNKILFTDEQWSNKLSTHESFPTRCISEVLRDNSGSFTHTRQVFQDLGFTSVSDLEYTVVSCLCKLVSSRSARLATVGIACMINRMEHTEVAIGVDGSLYTGNPLMHDLLTSALSAYVKPGVKFWFFPVKDGSGIGAAIVAAVAG